MKEKTNADLLPAGFTDETTPRAANLAPEYITRVKDTLTEVIKTEFKENNPERYLALVSEGATFNDLTEDYTNALFELCESRSNSARLKRLFKLSLDYINQLTDESGYIYQE